MTSATGSSGQEEAQRAPLGHEEEIPHAQFPLLLSLHTRFHLRIQLLLEDIRRLPRFRQLGPVKVPDMRGVSPFPPQLVPDGRVRLALAEGEGEDPRPSLAGSEEGRGVGACVRPEVGWLGES